MEIVRILMKIKLRIKIQSNLNGNIQQFTILNKYLRTYKIQRILQNINVTPQERAEWDYKTAVGIAEALSNSKVPWVPSIMIGGNDGKGGANAMDAVGLNMMLDVVKKLNENKK